MEKWKNPPSVNTEKLKLSLFSCYDRRLSRCPPPFFFVFVLFPSFFLSFFVFSSWREKGGRRGTQRRFEHRHSVYIYQNFFAFDRAIAIKMCSCNHCGLGCLLLFFLSPQLFNFSSNRRALKSPEDKTSSVHVPEDVSTS